jgi:quinol monooxygenase YgiN
MAKFAFLVELKAKPGKESEIEAFLKKEAVLASGEPGTVSWCAAKDEGEPGVYVIFDTLGPYERRGCKATCGECGEAIFRGS